MHPVIERATVGIRERTFAVPALIARVRRDHGLARVAGPRRSDHEQRLAATNWSLVMRKLVGRSMLFLSVLCGCSGTISTSPPDDGEGGVGSGAGGSGSSSTVTGSGGQGQMAPDAMITGRGGSTAKPDSGVDARSTGTGGAAPKADAMSSAPDAPTNTIAMSCNMTLPANSGTTSLSATMKVSGTFDGKMMRYVGTGDLGTSGQAEDQGPLFQLADGATLKNVILGNPAADGVHCSGNCTLQNVWWEDVGEDAATLQGSSNTQVMTIDGGGAFHASDKVFQHNGPGTMIIQNFFVSDFGKLYRSCGNCGTMYTRHVIIRNIAAVAPGLAIAGVNANYNDTATLSDLLLCDKAKKIAVCDRYTGNDTGAEPPLIGSGADGTNCIYSTSDVTWSSP
jgi:hypothetical protein